jgi:hypothetical protein
MITKYRTKASTVKAIQWGGHREQKQEIEDHLYNTLNGLYKIDLAPLDSELRFTDGAGNVQKCSLYDFVVFFQPRGHVKVYSPKEFVDQYESLDAKPESLDEEHRLYMIRYDTIDYCVQAKSMTDAIAVWKEHNANLPEGNGWDGSEDPEQVVQIHDDPVITRRKREA